MKKLCRNPRTLSDYTGFPWQRRLCNKCRVDREGDLTSWKPALIALLRLSQQTALETTCRKWRRHFKNNFNIFYIWREKLTQQNDSSVKADHSIFHWKYKDFHKEVNIFLLTLWYHAASWFILMLGCYSHMLSNLKLFCILMAFYVKMCIINNKMEENSRFLAALAAFRVSSLSL